MHAFLSVDFSLVERNLSRIPSECQTVWIHIRPTFVGPDPDPNCLQSFQQMTKSEENEKHVKAITQDISFIAIAWHNIATRIMPGNNDHRVIPLV